MSRAHMLLDSVGGVIEPESQWWRLPLYFQRALPDGNLYVVEVDDPDEPKTATWTFNDGADEDITPLAIRGITEPEYGHGLGYSVSSVTNVHYYLDVFCAGRPTQSDWWTELTRPGSHWHPGDGKIPHDEWGAELIRQSELFRQGIL